MSRRVKTFINVADTDNPLPRVFKMIIRPIAIDMDVYELHEYDANNKKATYKYRYTRYDTKGERNG